MARLDGPIHGRAIPPVRLLAILIFLIAVTGGLAYLVVLPIQQLYWGVYARVRPMVSEQDLLRQGKELPGGAEALRQMIEEVNEGEELAHARVASQAGAEVAESDDTDAGSGEGVDGALAVEEEAAQGTSLPLQEQEEQGGMVKPLQEEGGDSQIADQKIPKKEAGSTEQTKAVHEAPGAATVADKGTKHALSKELVAQVAQDNMVVVTWANFHYRDFVMNWVEHLQATGCKAFIIGAMDDKLLEFLVSKSIPAFSMSSGLTLDDFGWGTPTFHKMGREKINLLYTFTKMGFDVLISDVDTVWLRNPIPYMQQYPEADILTSSDHLTNTVMDEGLEKWPEAASAANIGIMLFRPKGHDLAAEWVDILENDAQVWDQNAFNDLFRRGAKPLPDRPDRLFECYNGKLKCGILPVSIFCSGHTGFTQRMPDKLGLKPYVVHATFQYSGTPGKRHRMRERLWWNDPPEYFRHEEGFILLNDTVPAALLESAVNVHRDFTLEATKPHFNLVNYQLAQIRAALALAQITGRAVILPSLICGMDRWWAPHDGTIPGSDLELPYPCPADHVLDLEAMSRDMPESEFGRNIKYREYSFLQNPRAVHLAKSVVAVQVCKDTLEGCADGSNAAEPVSKVQPKLNENQLKALLTQGELAKAQVLRFDGGIERLFGGWQDAMAGERFKRRLDLYAAIWCCVNAHPGHIWYDFFFDQVPHKDRHNRPVDGPWQPVTGP